MLLLLLSMEVSAEQPKFVPLKKDEIAPFAGRLFNDAAVSKLIVDKPNRTGWWLAGGFMLGTATSIGIMYVVKGDTQ